MSVLCFPGGFPSNQPKKGTTKKTHICWQQNPCLLVANPSFSNPIKGPPKKPTDPQVFRNFRPWSSSHHCLPKVCHSTNWVPLSHSFHGSKEDKGQVSQGTHPKKSTNKKNFPPHPTLSPAKRRVPQKKKETPTTHHPPAHRRIDASTRPSTHRSLVRLKGEHLHRPGLRLHAGVDALDATHVLPELHFLVKGARNQPPQLPKGPGNRKGLPFWEPC